MPMVLDVQESRLSTPQEHGSKQSPLMGSTSVLVPRFLP